jgi:hypothetical protein
MAAVLHIGDLARQHDALGGQADLLRLRRALQRRHDERLAHHLVGLARLAALRVGVHHAREQFGIERAPVHADAHGLRVLDRLLDHRRELLVALRAVADVARVDAVLVEHRGALGHLREELVAVEVEVAHQRHADTHGLEAAANLGHLARRFDGVHRDAHDLGAGAREGGDLGGGGGGVLGVGVGHRLHEDGGAAPDGLVGDAYRSRDAALAHELLDGEAGDRDLGVGLEVELVVVVEDLHFGRVADDHVEGRLARDLGLAAGGI